MVLVFGGDIRMSSKNNWKELLRRQQPQKQRFTIKKLKVGVASVLIGFTFMGMNASADTTTEANNADNQPAETTQSNTDSTQSNSGHVVLHSTTESATSGAQSTTGKAENTPAGNKDVNNGAATEKAAIQSDTDDQSVSGQATTNKLDKANNNASIVAQSLAVTTEGQTEEANDSTSFLNALRNGNTSTINLTGDVNFTGYNGSTDISGNYARQVTI